LAENGAGLSAAEYPEAGGMRGASDRDAGRFSQPLLLPCGAGVQRLRWHKKT